MIGEEVGGVLARRGHKVEWILQYDGVSGAACAITVDHDNGSLTAGADIRRESYAIGR